jgi:hypothetical protein
MSGSSSAIEPTAPQRFSARQQAQLRRVRAKLYLLVSAIEDPRMAVLLLNDALRGALDRLSTEEG